MLAPLFMLLLGFIVLMWSADKFVFGASHLARNMNISPMLIGLTVVAFGTSAPEIVVSIAAALKGLPEIALGNAVGSNIANIGLVVGITALIAPLTVKSRTIKKEFPVLFAITLLAILLLADAKLQRHDGYILLLGFGFLMVWLFYTGRKHDHDPLAMEFAAELATPVSTRRSLFWIVAGLILLPLSSHYLIIGNAVKIAEYYQVSQTFIGLTLIAIGTSLPEVATSVMGALKGEHDLALGNVIGSNMFNLLVVLSLPAIIAPFPVEYMILWRDLPVMSGFTIVLFLMAFGRNGAGRISRLEGGTLLAAYAAYLIWLVVNA